MSAADQRVVPGSASTIIGGYTRLVPGSDGTDNDTEDLSKGKDTGIQLHDRERTIEVGEGYRRVAICGGIYTGNRWRGEFQEAGPFFFWWLAERRGPLEVMKTAGKVRDGGSTS